jgi:hypothetical protein
MIYFFTPYSFNLKLLDAIARCMNLLMPDDWALLMDGDAMFLQPDFGHRIQRHVEAHPDAGLFTCYASRCHYSFHVPPGVDMENDSIRYHKLIANNLAANKAGEVKEINRITFEDLKNPVFISELKECHLIDEKDENRLAEFGKAVKMRS